MSKTKKILGMLAIGMAFFLIMGAFGTASAYENVFTGDTQIKGGLTVEGDLYANHNNLFFNPEGYPGVDPTVDFKRGGSMILESGDLFILSDDYVHIGPNKYGSPVGKVLIQDPNEIALKSRTANGWLAAGTLETNDLQVKNNASFHGIMVNDGALTFGTGSSADFANVAITNFGSGGFTIGGDIDMNGYDLLNLHDIDMDGVIENTAPGGWITIADGLNVQGNLWNSTSSLNINDDMVVTGNADTRSWIINSTGFVYVNDTFAVSGVTDMQNTIWSSSGDVYINDGLTVTSLSNLNGGISVNGGVFTVSTAGNMVIAGTSNFKDQIYNSISELYINDDAIIDGTLYARDILAYASDNFYDIGSWNRRFHDGYLGSALYVGANTDPGDIYSRYDLDGITTYNSNLFLNSSTGSVTIDPSSGAIFLIPGATGTGVSYSRNLNPYNDASAGTYSLGASGQEWRNLYLSNYLDVAYGNFTVDSSGNTFIAGTFEVDGQADFDGNVDANNGVDVTNADLTVGGTKFTVDDATGNIFTSGNLRSIGLAILDGGIDMLASTFQVDTSGNVRALGNLDVRGNLYDLITALTINDDLIVTGTSDLQGAISNSTGVFNINDNATIGFTLGVTGVVTANAGVLVDGTTFDANTLNSGGNNFAINSGAADINLTSASVNLASNNALNVGGGYTIGGSGTSLYPNGDSSMNGNLVVGGTGLFTGMLFADNGIDTSAAGTPLMIGGVTANNVYLDAIATLNVGIATPTVNIDATGTLNIGGAATMINFGNSGSTTNLSGLFTGAGSGSGLNADMVDGKHFASGTVPVAGPPDPAYMGGRSAVICNITTGLGAIGSVTATIEDLKTTTPLPLAVMIFAHTDTWSNLCGAGGPPVSGTFHAVVYDLSGSMPPPPGGYMLHWSASQ